MGENHFLYRFSVKAISGSSSATTVDFHVNFRTNNLGKGKESDTCPIYVLNSNPDQLYVVWIHTRVECNGKGIYEERRSPTSFKLNSGADRYLSV